MPYLRKVTFHKLRGVVPGTTLEFGPKGAVLLGKNGTGKTTLLNAISTALHSEYKSLSKEDFDFEWKIESDLLDIQLRTTSEHTPTASDHPVLDPTSHSTRRFGMALHVHDKESQPIISIEHKDGALNFTSYRDNEEDVRDTRSATSSDGQVTYSDFVSLARTLASNPKLLYNQELIKSIPDFFNEMRATSRFDESLGGFSSIVESKEASEGPLSKMSATVVLFHSTDKKIKALSSSCGRAVRESMIESTRAELSDDHISTDNVSFLKEFCKLCSFSHGKMTALFSRRQSSGSGDLSNDFYIYSPFIFSFTRGTSTFPHSDLSYGQKRLLSFLWYLDANPTYVVADELVNGMHYDWIAHCMKELQTRQAFLSSQNPLLFDFMTFDSPEDIRGQFVLCDLDEEQRFRWRNMTLEESTDIFTAYQAGIQHIGEILRTRGYW